MNAPLAHPSMLDPALIEVRVGDVWEDATQRRFRVLAVTPTHVRAVTTVGRTAGRTSTISRVRFHPCSSARYRLIRRNAT